MKFSINKSKKMLALLLAIVLSLGAFIGCSNKNEKSNEEPPEKVSEKGEDSKTEKPEKSDDEKEDEGEEKSTKLKIGGQFVSTDTLDPNTAMSPGIMVVMYSIYDSLAFQALDGIHYSLAESIEPNESADQWTIKLRDGVVFSDGTPITGKDVLDSIAHLSESQNYKMLYGNVNFEDSKAEGDTAVIKLNSPESDFLTSSLSLMCTIAPEGKFEGVGAGPYTYEKGDVQSGFLLAANEKYWSGKPPIPELEVLSIPDPSAQMNALKTGEIDMAFGLNSSAIKQVEQDENIQIPDSTMDSAMAQIVVFNTRVAPFDDLELRQAAKLVVDREKMVNILLGESGEIGNDILGKGYQGYPDSIEQRTQDIEKAKKVFEEKGVKEFTLMASDIVPGQVATAELLAQEFEEIGVKVNVEVIEPQSFFAQIEDIFGSSAFTFYNINRAPMGSFRSLSLSISPFNASGYISDVVEENFAKAASTTDEKEREQYLEAIYKDIHENDGNMIWGYQKQFSASRKGLTGLETYQSVPWLARAKYIPED